MPKQIIYWDDSRAKMFAWIETVAKTVTKTMWPKWRNVILDKWYGAPQVTNDWVTIAKEIELEDKFENMWAELVKDAAEKTNSLAWDGTTTATLLTYAIAKEGQRYLKAWVNAVELKNGLNKAWAVISQTLEDNAKKISSKEEIAQVATISAQDSEVWNIIAEAMEKVGNTWVISVEEGQTFGLEVEVTQGMEFDQGYISPYMITDTEKMLAEYKGAYMLITDQKISNMKDLLPLLEQLMEEGKKDLVIMCDDIEWEALTTIILNKLKWVLNILAVKTPGFWDSKKDIMKDIAVLTWSKIITSDLAMKLSDVTLGDLWKAKTIISSAKNTTIIGGEWDINMIWSRVEEIKKAISLCDSDYQKEKLAERLAKLDWGVAVVKVWAASEVEMKEKKLRIEDALNATRAAIEEWVVAGWWTALLKASLALSGVSFGNSDQDLAIEIILKALEYPVKQIATNAWKDWWVVSSKILEHSDINYGYNAATDEFVDMVELGIIDPKKVARIALEQAISLSGMFLTTEAAITDIPKKDDDAPAWGGMPWMGGMWGMGWMWGMPMM